MFSTSIVSLSLLFDSLVSWVSVVTSATFVMFTLDTLTKVSINKVTLAPLAKSPIVHTPVAGL